LLPSGKVLVAAGSYGGTFLASAELYDPASGTWSATGDLNIARYRHTATLLPNDKVLVAGGSGGTGSLDSAELYDPASGIWTSTGSLNDAWTDAKTRCENSKPFIVHSDESLTVFVEVEFAVQQAYREVVLCCSHPKKRELPKSDF
jgi:hypothetical protein